MMNVHSGRVCRAVPTSSPSIEQPLFVELARCRVCAARAADTVFEAEGLSDCDAVEGRPTFL